MAFCPRCGAPTTSAMSFCTACGESLAPAVYPPSSPVAQPAPPAAPPVPRREPWVVLVLTLVTLGIYTVFYWWNVSKEVDARAGRPGHAHGLVKIGILVGVVAAVVLVVAAFSFMGTFFAAAVGGEEPDPAALLGTMAGGIVTLVLAGLAGFAGAIVLLVGKYRVWQTIEEAERARQSPQPLSAGLLLALTLVGMFVGFIPFVGILGLVMPLVVLYMTTDHLNRAWAAQPA